MFNKKKQPAGASEKVENARRMIKEGYFDVNAPSKGGGKASYPSQTIPVAAIYFIAIVISIVISSNNANPLSGLHITGIPALDSFITGTNTLGVTGNPQEDNLISIFAPGTALFFLAGFAPIIAALLERLLLKYKVMPLIICWFVIMAAMLAGFEGHNIATFFNSIF